MRLGLPVTEQVVLLVLCHIKYSMLSHRDDCEQKWQSNEAAVWAKKVRKLQQGLDTMAELEGLDTRAELEGKLDELEQGLIGDDVPFGPVAERPFHMRLV